MICTWQDVDYNGQCKVSYIYRNKSLSRKPAICTYFIPAYAPSLVPIELYFGNLKAKVNKMIIEMFLEDEDQSELDVLVRSIKTIDGDAIKRIWRTFTGKIKQDLGIINDNQSF